MYMVRIISCATDLLVVNECRSCSRLFGSSLCSPSGPIAVFVGGKTCRYLARVRKAAWCPAFRFSGIHIVQQPSCVLAVPSRSAGSSPSSHSPVEPPECLSPIPAGCQSPREEIQQQSVLLIHQVPLAVTVSLSQRCWRGHRDEDSRVPGNRRLSKPRVGSDACGSDVQALLWSELLRATAHGGYRVPITSSKILSFAAVYSTAKSGPRFVVEMRISFASQRTAIQQVSAQPGVAFKRVSKVLSRLLLLFTPICTPERSSKRLVGVNVSRSVSVSPTVKGVRQLWQSEVTSPHHSASQKKQCI